MTQLFNVQDKSIHIVAKKEYVGDADSRGPVIWKAWVMENEGIHAYGKTKEEAVTAAKKTAESLYEYIPPVEIREEENDLLPEEQITSISILRGSFGCAGCSNHFDIDPYYNRKNWSDAARGDGMSYSGAYGSVTREKGESLQSLLKRANTLADEIRHEYDLDCRNWR